MKKLKKVVCYLLVLTMMLGINVNADSSESKKNYPENFMDMSVQQRIEWIDENIPAEVYQGIRVNYGQKGSLERYYGTAEEILYDPTGDNKLAELETAVEWTVDSSAPTVVQSYDVTRFDVYNYMPGGFSKKEPIDSLYVNQGNVKVFLQATAFSTYIAYGIFNDYNLHYWGDFSIRTDHFAY